MVAPEVEGHPDRHFMCGLLFGIRATVQAVRLSWVPLLVLVSEEFDISTMGRGAILSAFPLGYLCTQMIGGAVADRFGGKPVQTMTLAVMVLGMLAAPVAAINGGVKGLWIVYFLIGLFAGPQHPAFNTMVSAWFPQSELPWASSICEAGPVTGNFVALFVAPQIASRFGWPFAFLVMATLAGMFLVVWIFFAKSAPPPWPAAPPSIKSSSSTAATAAGSGASRFASTSGTTPNNQSPKEIKINAENGFDATAITTLTTAAVEGAGLVGKAPAPPTLTFQAVKRVLQYFFRMPTYYDTIFGIPPHEASFYLLTAELVGVVSQLACGKLEQAVRTRYSLSILGSRRLFSAAGFGMITVVFLLMASFPSPGRQCVWLSMATMSNAAHSAGFKSNYLDLTKTHQGLLMGAGNTVATLITFIFPILVAFQLTPDAGSTGVATLDAGVGDATSSSVGGGGEGTASREAWSFIFVAIAALCASGAVVSTTLTSVDSIDVGINQGAY